MQNKKFHVFFIVGCDQKSVRTFTSILCQKSQYFYESAPGKAVVHSKTVLSANNNQDKADKVLIDQSTHHQNLPQYLSNHCKHDACLILGDVIHMQTLAQWLSACKELDIHTRALYLHQSTSQDQISQIRDLYRFELLTRESDRSAINLDSRKSYNDQVTELIANRLSASRGYIAEALHTVHDTLTPGTVEQSYSYSHLRDLLIHNCNSIWAHQLDPYDIEDCLEYALPLTESDSDFTPSSLVEIHHRDLSGDAITRLIIPITSPTLNAKIDLRSYEEIHLLYVYPINSTGIVQIDDIKLITKSNKTISPVYNIQGDHISDNNYIINSDQARITINVGIYALAMKYLTLTLRPQSLSNGLVKLVKLYGKSTPYPLNKHITLESNPHYILNLKYAVDTLLIFQNKYLIVKGWAYSDYPNLKINLTYLGVTHPISLSYLRDEVAQLSKSQSNENNAYWEVITLSQKSTNVSNTNATLTISTDKEVQSFKLQIRHVDRPSAMTLDNQYAIQQVQWSQSPNPNKLTIDLTKQYKISIITPVYNVEPKWMDLCIESVLSQTYDNWELCLYDDGSTNTDTLDCLKKWESYGDSRLKIGYGKENVNISGATNAAIAMGSGDYVTFLDNDDTLTPDALYVVMQYLTAYPDTTLLYSDEDKLEMTGHRTGPYFKSDFNIDLLRSNNYFTHLTVVKYSLGEKIGWIRLGYEGAQDHDFVLRAVDATDQKTIKHIPEVLYHWRKLPTSTAGNYGAKDYAYQAGVKALLDHMVRNGIQGIIERGPWGGAYRMVRDIVAPLKVSIIIPFKDHINYLKELIPSINKLTLYEDYEIVLVNNQSSQKETAEYLSTLTAEYDHISVIDYNEPFNYAAMNNWAVQQVDGDYILLLNNDMKVINHGWLGAMVEHIQRPEVGVVGCKLLYEDDTLQHAGVLMGINGSAGHAFKGMPNGAHYFNMGVIKNVSGVTGACLLTKRALYLSLGGLDEEHFKIAYNDVDYCLKVRQSNLLIVYTPYSSLYHYESKSRGYEDTPEKEARHLAEKQALQSKWGDQCLVDPYYNPNLSYLSQANALAIDVK